MAQERKYSLNHRRLRQSETIRNLVKEVRVSQDQLIQPLFVVQGLQSKEGIPGLTGVYRETEETVLRQIESDLENGVKSFLLFGVPNVKQEKGFNSDFTSGVIQGIKNRFGKDLFLAVDVCLCSYTQHGHCGILAEEGDHVLNHESVSYLAKFAAQYAGAGADCVAPSDMMDGRIAAIRSALDQNQLDRTLIMSYSAKFHSGFYGPFRVAADSAPKGKVTLKDRATYQIDPGHPQDAYTSSIRDLEEGADILMVKPGLPYLDVLSELSRRIQAPWAVYEVSGEYAAIEVLAGQGLMNGPRGHLESWTAFVRAGAEMIITYGARRFKEFTEKTENQ